MPKVSIKYTESKDYKRVSATGVVGATTPQGFIQAELYLEIPDLPDSFELEINEEGDVVKETHEVKSFTREKQVGLLLRPDMAIAIGQWLISKAEETKKVIS